MAVPVVLVHGLRSSAAEWDTIRSILENDGHEVIAPDLPGHGSRRDEQFTIGESLVTIADACRSAITQPALIGHALGGHLAIETQSVTGIAAGLVAIGAGTEVLSWLLDSYRIASATSALLPDRGGALSAAAARTFVGSAAPSLHDHEFTQTLGQLRALDTRGALQQVRVPTWLLNGQFDRFRMQERAFVKSGNGVKLVRQPRARLAERFDAPAATASLLEGMLCQLP